jgi:hypothetical protein
MDAPRTPRPEGLFVFAIGLVGPRLDVGELAVTNRYSHSMVPGGFDVMS